MPEGDNMLGDIALAARKAAQELFEKANLLPGQTVIVGCSTSEIAGHKIGTDSNIEIGFAVFDSIHEVLSEHNVFVAAQCCEHLNRAIVIERKAARGFEIVNAVPKPNAGGAFASAAYSALKDPILIESVIADAGLDIGGTLIGMHLRRVAVPLRLEMARIGLAAVTAARTRPPLIGGSRAVYDEKLF